MNKIDEIISTRYTPSEDRRIYCLVLFDYYLDLYDELIRRRFPNRKHQGINNKAMINFLFVCLNSVEQDYGLFEIFHSFKVSCGWSHRIIDVSHPDVERLFAMMPSHRLTGHKWEKRNPQQRPQLWNALEGKPISDFIKDSSVGRYALLIERGINELLSQLPDDCLVDFGTRRNLQSEWIKWMNLTADFNLTQHAPVKFNNRSCNICANFALEELRADKQLLLESL